GGGREWPMGGRESRYCGAINACFAKRREVGGNESSSCGSDGSGQKISRLNARTEYRRARAFALHTKCPVSRGISTYGWPGNEGRQDAFSGNQHRSAGQTRLHASSRSDGRVDQNIGSRKSRWRPSLTGRRYPAHLGVDSERQRRFVLP